MGKIYLTIRTGLLVILLYTGLLTGCQKSVILELADQEDSFLIIEANILDDGLRQHIRISRSTSYYEESEGKGIADARVWLESDEKKYIFNAIRSEKRLGFYYNDSVSSELKGKELSLFVEYQGTIYTAISRWKPVPEIDSVSLTLNSLSILGLTSDTLYEVWVHFRELPSDDDHYLFNLYVNGNIKTWRPSLKVVTSNKNMDEYVTYSIRNLSQDEIKEGDVIQVEMRSISKENYEFYNAFLLQTDLSGNPFAGSPPANIPTNISNGAHGFFQVSSVSRKSIVF
jgi:hypothetical protein